MESPNSTVYILKNADNPPRYYTGVTANLKAPLDAHNAGHCAHLPTSGGCCAATISVASMTLRCEVAALGPPNDRQVYRRAIAVDPERLTVASEGH